MKILKKYILKFNTFFNNTTFYTDCGRIVEPKNK